MTAIELLARLHRRNVRVWAEDGRLRYDAPKGALTETLRLALEPASEARETVVVYCGGRRCVATADVADAAQMAAVAVLAPKVDDARVLAESCDGPALVEGADARAPPAREKAPGASVPEPDELDPDDLDQLSDDEVTSRLRRLDDGEGHG